MRILLFLGWLSTTALLLANPPFPLVDGTYSLTLQEIAAHPRTAFPADGAYQKKKDAKPVILRISETGKRVRIDFEKPVQGTLVKQDKMSSQYRLKDLFAGGHLRIEPTATGPRATFVVLGSGVPVIRSERGPVTIVRDDG